MTVIYTSVATVPAEGGPEGEEGLDLSHLALVVDLDRCIGCQACELHCKLENGIPSGPGFLRVVEASLDTDGQEGTSILAVPVPCAHCDAPPCVDVCPTGAMQRRTDGIVFIDEERCLGCMVCGAMCPYGVPRYSPELDRAVKCDLCRRRVDQGLWPACATKCSMKAMYFGPLHQLARVRAEKGARQAAEVVMGVRIRRRYCGG